MTTTRIIPCLDVDLGRVVKGVNFFNLKDAGDPVELAMKYDQEGADELVLLNISASGKGKEAFFDVIKKLSKRISVPFIVGGGIGSLEDIHQALTNGADRVSINSAAVKDPNLVEKAARRFGSKKIVLAIDAKKQDKDKWGVYINGGRSFTGLDVLDWAKKVKELGASEVLLTSMDRDGTKDGYDLDLIKRVKELLKLPIIASGGAGDLKHFLDAVIIGKADAVLAASLFHYGSYTIFEVKEYLKKSGVKVK